MPIKSINSVPNFLFETPKNKTQIKRHSTNTNIRPIKIESIFDIFYNILYFRTI
jgi:hypothetical protein